MVEINKKSFFWNYLSSGQKDLMEVGLFLYKDAKENQSRKLGDYSYLVFSFAKAYEGFLKKLFLDMGFISKKEYESNRFVSHIRRNT